MRRRRTGAAATPAETPAVALLGTSMAAPMFAAAIDHLRWRCLAVAGERTAEICAATGAEPVDRDHLVDRAAVDVAVVSEPGDAGTDEISRLARRGVHVVASTRGLGLAAAAEGIADASGTVTAAEPFATAPVVQACFRRVADLGPVVHLSGRSSPAAGDRRAEPATTGDHDQDTRLDQDTGLDRDTGLDLDASMIAVALLLSRLARWGRVDTVGCTRATGPARVITIDFEAGRAGLTVGGAGPGGRPAWELQLASERHAARVELLPVPMLEIDGARIGLPPAAHPAEAFGFAPLLRTVWADAVAGRRPALDASFAAAVCELVAAAERSVRSAGRPVRLGDP